MINKLKKGDIIKTITGITLEVLDISETSILVRPIEKQKQTIKNRFGDIIEFERPQHPYRISLNSEISLIKRNK